jgi:hypothetical protein
MWTNCDVTTERQRAFLENVVALIGNPEKKGNSIWQREHQRRCFASDHQRLVAVSSLQEDEARIP